jgi:cytochrome P450
MVNSLPPGPRMPSALQTIGWWSRPTAFLERCRARYGKRFTIRLLGQSPIVVLSDPAEIKALFQAPPDVLHPGEGAQIVEPVVGRHSVILLDEEKHMEQRKLLLPAFHGEKMQRVSGVMAELAQREVASWPLDEPVWLHPRLQRVTLEIILRTVFGLERGAQLDSLRELLTEILTLGDSPLSLLPPAQRLLAGRGPMAAFERTRAKADELIYALIDERRGAARRAHDGARRGPRDDRLAARVGGRPHRPRAGGTGPPAR